MIRYRHEYKYPIDACQEGILKVKAKALMRIDPHAANEGYYIVRSVYLDDRGDSCLLDNINGNDPRSKYRIRYYNQDIGMISLEKKSKRRQGCLKEACILRPEECQALLNGETPQFDDKTPALKKKLFTEIQCLGLYPKVIVTYVREPYVYSAGNVRITFDSNITSSNKIGDFLKGAYAQRPVLSTGHTILEVKWDEIMPRHIKDALRIENLQWTAFSKYSACRMLHL